MKYFRNASFHTNHLIKTFIMLQKSHKIHNFLHHHNNAPAPSPRVILPMVLFIPEWDRDIPWEKLLLGTCSHNASIISYKHANNNLRKAVSSEQRNWIVIWSVWLLCLKLNQKSLTFNKVLLAKCLVEPRVKLSVRFHLWRFGLSPELEL